MTGGNGQESVPLDAVIVDDRDSFEEFFRSERRALLRLAWSLTGRRDLAEEAVQEVMVTVHQRWSKISTYDRPGAFARRVLLNDLISTARRQRAEQRANARSQRGRVQTEPAVEPPDPIVWEALRALPERQAQAVALHYLDDLPLAEIADVLGVTEGTVKVHLHRGRLALAERLRPELTKGEA